MILRQTEKSPYPEIRYGVRAFLSASVIRFYRSIGPFAEKATEESEFFSGEAESVSTDPSSAGSDSFSFFSTAEAVELCLAA